MKKLPSYKEWLKWLSSRSLIFETYGSFLREQEKVFSELHTKLAAETKKVWTFSAPTASGKTHVMLLLADFLAQEHSVAVIVPDLSRRGGQKTYLSVTDALNEDLKLAHLCNLLNLYPRRILVLFNNLVSCRKAHRYLSKHLGKTQVFHISSYEESQSRMKRYIEYLKHDDGILLSSSNVFWEGISVKDLGLLVIADIPYPRPSLFELTSGQKEDARKLVLRRLKQGLGRIGRTDSGGICVLMFDIKRALRGMTTDLDVDIKRKMRFGGASEVFQIVKAVCS